MSIPANTVTVTCHYCNTRGVLQLVDNSAAIQAYQGICCNCSKTLQYFEYSIQLN
jgi:hypothetical protein